ncbi:MAG: hypothetical protein Q7U23_03375 [Methylococcales bacterium]|nr:hypothetical protein [Methylococcales bacterium]
MLDNELYKAIKALRETQEWRLDALVWLCFGKTPAKPYIIQHNTKNT